MKEWRNKALFLLDEAERAGSAQPLSINGFADQCGVSRWTIWRDVGVRDRYKEVVSQRSEGSNSGKGRRSQEQRMRLLVLENEELKRRNEALLQNFIVISRRLVERGIDPVVVLGVLAPSTTCDAWKTQILDWEDQ